MTDNRPPTIDDLTRVTEPESTAPEYLAWKKAKIEAALRHAEEHPDSVFTEQEIWQMHGLAY
jgi:hypothetical protein